MPLAICAMAHTPLMNFNEPGPGVRAEVEAVFADARAKIAAFDPDVIVMFAPDHYNGLLSDMMPPFCVGFQARSFGDYGTLSGPLNVDRELGEAIVQELFASDVDIAYSERLLVDHGVAQSLELLLGSLDAKPIVPIIINSVAEPMGPPLRSIVLGEAVGRVIANLDKKVLLIASGGLSHDPPVPRFSEVPPEVQERLIAGRNRPADAQAAHEARVIATGIEFAAGRANIMPLNPKWDTDLMNILTSGDLSPIHNWTTEWMTEQGGHSGHEVRCWIAAYAALGVAGKYNTSLSYYRAIDEWVAGFGIAFAQQA